MTQNLMGSKLDQELSSNFYHEDPSGIISIMLLTNRHTNKQT